MNKVKAPRSLRFEAAINSVNQTFENNSGKTVSAVAGLIAVASFSGAEAQQSSLPPVTVDAPVARPRPAAAKPSADQIRARTALRRAAQRQQAAQVAAVPFPNAGGLSADRNPYANPNAPYMATRVQASGKFPEPILNTPKTITVLTKEVLADQNSTTLKSAVLNTAGVTLGTGEGGNAFGDRFFIRGFDARNDVFLDGIRDAGVSVRENFFTEQVEILPRSRLVLCRPRHHRRRDQHRDQAGDDREELLQHGHHVRHRSHQAGRARRQPGDQPDAGDSRRRPVPGCRRRRPQLHQGRPRRRLRRGKVDAARYREIVRELHPHQSARTARFRRAVLPAGLAQRRYTTTAGGPFPDFGVNRNKFYGLVNRDYYSIKQDIGTFGGEVSITPDLTLSNKSRVQRSVLDYIGTLPEGADH